MREIVEGLCGELEDDDLAGESFDRSTPRFVEPDTEDHLRAAFLQQHWTDALPIVLPTDTRVQAMLAHTSHQPDEIVGRLRVSGTRLQPRDHPQESLRAIAAPGVGSRRIGHDEIDVPTASVLSPNRRCHMPWLTSATARCSSSGCIARPRCTRAPVRSK